MAFSPVNAAVLTATTVTVGQWSAGEPLTPRYIVGGAFLAISLAVLNEMSEKLAAQFALLILVVTAFRWGPAIFHKFGLIDDAAYNAAKGWAA